MICLKFEILSQGRHQLKRVSEADGGLISEFAKFAERDFRHLKGYQAVKPNVIAQVADRLVFQSCRRDVPVRKQKALKADPELAKAVSTKRQCPVSTNSSLDTPSSRSLEGSPIL